MEVNTDVFLALRGEVAGLGAAVEELDRRQRTDLQVFIRGLAAVTSVLSAPGGRHAAPQSRLRLIKGGRP